MAPTGPQMNNRKFTPRGGDWKKSTNNTHGAKLKRKWVPEQKVYEGSVQEGQGFALKRKEKVKHEYNKLLRKERRKLPDSTALYKDEYPEHLRHLYVAEAHKLKNEAWTHRLNRSKLRVKSQEKEEEDYLKNSKQKEEAIKKYKDKKMETFQILSRKTKKGQPNLNLQMEYLLQKIQGTGK
ncbi:Thyroid transcription factor 1-associated protein 26 [Liparis tanakae]|uniref:Thyroid transcription factor 1-associated protein 26 n=1 Tax=Liparis tanakae TaxID=230148 RepID=A0A4Z2GSM4_9TELE|nr:Thyroid transcription factor 1-associated protein 26 [Liparis tanakae]